MLIAGEIFNLTDQYTNDSSLSKFFLSDEVANSCYILSGGFAALVYDPPLEPEEIQDTYILSFLYALLTYGFNIYLKERSLNTNSAPYSLPADKRFIKKMQKKTLSLTSKGKLSSTPLLVKIVTIIIENIDNKVSLKEFRIKNHKIKKKKLLDYSRISLYWGYNFAQQLLEENKA